MSDPDPERGRTDAVVGRELRRLALLGAVLFLAISIGSWIITWESTSPARALMGVGGLLFFALSVMFFLAFKKFSSTGNSSTQEEMSTPSPGIAKSTARQPDRTSGQVGWLLFSGLMITASITLIALTVIEVSQNAAPNWEYIFFAFMAAIAGFSGYRRSRASAH